MMHEALDRIVTTLAWCWRLERRDGVVMGLTSHDRALTIDGLRYAASPGMTPSAIVRSVRFDAEPVELSGALSASLISAEDLELGRWDRAHLTLFLADWESGAQVAELAQGTLGVVERGERGFAVALSGLGASLEISASPSTSPGCRSALGDNRCRVDPAALQMITKIDTVAEDGALTLSALSGTGALYIYGSLRPLDGTLAGIRHSIASGSGNSLRLRTPPRRTLEPGTRVELIQGCDKAFATCRDRFANALNFRGEPHLPGNDLLTRYPGG